MDNITLSVFIPDWASLVFQTQNGLYVFREAAISERTSSEKREEVRIVTFVSQLSENLALFSKSCQSSNSWQTVGVETKIALVVGWETDAPEM